MKKTKIKKDLSKKIKEIGSENKVRGITLISLIVTIIILIILAGIAIVELKNTNLFGNTTKAKNKNDYAAAQEEINIKLAAIETDYEMHGNEKNKLQYTADKLCEDDEIEYVQTKSKKEASIEKITLGQDVTKIYTKLKKYKYEFEIGDNFKLVAINGKELDDDKPYDETYKTGQISDTEYKINGETLNFKKIVKVGENSEYKTIKQGLDYLCDNNYKENVAIVLEAGTYATKDIHTGSSYSINTKYNEMEISIIADSPGDVFIAPGEMGMGQNGAQYGIKLNFYRIIFIEPINSDAGNNGFHLNEDKYTKKYFNCVFNASPGGYNAIISDSNAEMYNCIFLKGVNTYYYNYPIKGIKQNCASTTSEIPPQNATEITCLKNATIDSNYNITSTGWKNTGTGTNPDGTKANIGVYGGKYAWQKLDRTYLDYPLLTSTGMKNVIKKDKNGKEIYEAIANYVSTKQDALPYACYDDDINTCYTMESGKTSFRFDVDNSAIGKKYRVILHDGSSFSEYTLCSYNKNGRLIKSLVTSPNCIKTTHEVEIPQDTTYIIWSITDTWPYWCFQFYDISPIN